MAELYLEYNLVIHKYGLSHGLIVAGLMALVWVYGPFAVGIVGFLGAAYFYNRERKARLRDGVTRFRDWYPDSKGDAITPLVVAIAGTLIRLL